MKCVRKGREKGVWIYDLASDDLKKPADCVVNTSKSCLTLVLIKCDSYKEVVLYIIGKAGWLLYCAIVLFVFCSFCCLGEGDRGFDLYLSITV